LRPSAPSEPVQAALISGGGRCPRPGKGKEFRCITAQVGGALTQVLPRPSPRNKISAVSDHARAGIMNESRTFPTWPHDPRRHFRADPKGSQWRPVDQGAYMARIMDPRPSLDPLTRPKTPVGVWVMTRRFKVTPIRLRPASSVCELVRISTTPRD